jgi:hypothetical protein
MQNSFPFQRRKTFLHTGHIGDIIAFLPSFQALNGTTIVVQDGERMVPMRGFKFDSLKPLLESQGIETTMNFSGFCIDVNVSGWRECYRDDISLLDSQARYLGVVPKKTGRMNITEPWIKVEKNKKLIGKTIFNRTPRYRNDRFSWEKIYDKYGENSIFIGTEEEHDEFCKKIGAIQYYQTKNCLEVAEAINGCDLFIGNQSSSFWIAAALRKPLIQEVFPPCPNSIIEYPEAQYLFHTDDL